MCLHFMTFVTMCKLVIFIKANINCYFCKHTDRCFYVYIDFDSCKNKRVNKQVIVVKHDRKSWAITHYTKTDQLIQKICIVYTSNIDNSKIVYLQVINTWNKYMGPFHVKYPQGFYSCLIISQDNIINISSANLHLLSYINNAHIKNFGVNMKFKYTSGLEIN